MFVTELLRAPAKVDNHGKHTTFVQTGDSQQRPTSRGSSHLELEDKSSKTELCVIRFCAFLREATLTRRV